MIFYVIFVPCVADPRAPTRRHTHEKVDQVFSRFSLALGRNNAHTLSEFVHIIQAAYTPSPVVKELPGTLDMQAWLLPHLNSIRDVTKPHQFLFSKDPSAECGSSVVCQEFCNTPPQPKVEVLTSLPTTRPLLRGGRKLFHRSQQAGGSSAQADRDFIDMEKQLQTFFETYDFPSSSREEWRLTVESLKKKEASASKNLPTGYFWPLSAKDVRDRCKDDSEDDSAELQAANLRQRALAHARMREVNRFQGMMCGPGIRYKSTEPEHATLGNIVVIRNHVALPESLLLGKYESLFSIGKVRLPAFMKRLCLLDYIRRLATHPCYPLVNFQLVYSSELMSQVVSSGPNKRKRDQPGGESSDEPRTRKVLYYEPYVTGKGGADRPLWLHNLEAGDGERVDSSWDSVVTMQWRPIKQLPLATFEGLNHLDGQEDFRCPETQIDRDFMGTGQAVAKLKNGWEQTLEIFSFAYVCELTSAEKGRGRKKGDGDATINFDAETQLELTAMVFEAEDGHFEYIGDHTFSPDELGIR
jgi:hypothetical protein